MNGHVITNNCSQWAYPLRLEMDIRWSLLVGEQKDIVAVLDEYFDQLINFQKHTEAIKSIILQVSIIVSRKLIQLNGQINTFQFDYLKIANALDSINNVQDLKFFFHQYILSISVYYKHLLESKGTIVTAKNYINSNYHREILLPDIAEMVRMSPTYFSRLFSKSMNFSFQNYLTHVRINIAKNILINTSLAVEDVGALVGYFDVNYFIRVFKKITGVTPGGFIKCPDYKDYLLKTNNNGKKDEGLYPLGTESMLLWSILCRDESAAEKIGKELIINLYRQGTDIHDMKSIILHLTIVLLRKCLQSGFAVENMLIRTIYLYREINNLNSHFEMKIFFSNVTSTIIRSGGGDNNYKEQIILKIKSFVKENYNHNISLNDIAALVHLSPNYISRVFSLNTGMTLRHYMMNVRLETAKSLLINTDLSVEEISCLVGYLDVSYFRKIFKQKLGITPSSLRVNAGKKILDSGEVLNLKTIKAK